MHKTLIYHPIAQRYYKDLQYKAEEKTKYPIGLASIRKGKSPRGIIQTMYNEVMWSKDVQTYG
jgi:hypothetical protein